MNHIGLFEGIGGFSLAAEWMGWETIAWVEWNQFCQKILSQKYLNAKQHGDIRTTDFSVYRGQCDILTGGFPCQPYSLAGKRKGKEDDRHLWPEMLRAIREIQPRWIVGENVFGLINWSKGLVFHEVQSDLETEGYEVFPFVLPACGVNAPHRRDRVWFVAFNSEFKSNGRHITGKSSGNGLEMVWHFLDQAGRVEGANNFESSSGNVANTENIGHECGSGNNIGNSEQLHKSEQGWNEKDGCEFSGCGGAASNSPGIRHEGRITETDTRNIEMQSGRLNRINSIQHWQYFPTQSPVCDGNDGFSTESLRQRIREDCLGIISEKEINKIISAATSQWRKETIKAGGNAIVPQVVLQIYKAIEQYERSIQ